MSNEIQVRASLAVKVGNNPASIDYQNRPADFKADVETAKGPTPGVVTAATIPGTSVDLSQLQRPGMVNLRNQDLTNFITYGIWDGTFFYPLGELLPGEHTVFRFSRFLNEEFVGTGTNSDVNAFRLVADTADCNVLVEAFDT